MTGEVFIRRIRAELQRIEGETSQADLGGDIPDARVFYASIARGLSDLEVLPEAAADRIIGRIARIDPAWAGWLALCRLVVGRNLGMDPRNTLIRWSGRMMRIDERLELSEESGTPLPPEQIDERIIRRPPPNGEAC